MLYLTNLATLNLNKYKTFVRLLPAGRESEDDQSWLLSFLLLIENVWRTREHTTRCHWYPGCFWQRSYCSVCQFKQDAFQQHYKSCVRRHMHVCTKKALTRKRTNQQSQTTYQSIRTSNILTSDSKKQVRIRGGMEGLWIGRQSNRSGAFIGINFRPRCSSNDACLDFDKHSVVATALRVDLGEAHDLDWTQKPTTNGGEYWNAAICVCPRMP